MVGYRNRKQVLRKNNKIKKVDCPKAPQGGLGEREREREGERGEGRKKTWEGKKEESLFREEQT